jgi:hypothetical protein
MTIITPTGITGINSITSSGSTLVFQSASGTSPIVTGLDNISSAGVITATRFVGDITGNINSSGVSTFINGPLIIGAAISTGTVTQPLQVTGGAYVSGSFGIGITNPGAKLQVSGGQILLDNNTNSSGNSYIGFGTNNITRIVGRDGNTSPAFLTFNIGTVGESARFDSAGNLGVGTTNPQTKLQVGAATSQSVFITSSGNVGLASTNPRVSLDASQETDAIALPQGTTAQRPSGNAPYIRYNTTNSALEFYNGTDWVEIISDYFPTGSVILG